jgi:Ger(x)C family germination protein
VTAVKRIHSFFLILPFFITLFSGCWDWVELNDITIVSGISLDEAKEPDKIRLTAQVIRPAALGGEGDTGGTAGGEGGGGGGAEAQAARILTTTGETVFQAIRDLSTQASHKLFLSHTHVVVISREAAEKGIYRFIDFFARDPEPRPNIRLLISEGEAGEIMRHPSGVESIPALGLYSATKTAALNALSPDVTMQDASMRLASETTELIAPLTKLYQEKGTDGEKKTRVDVAGTAVFRGDKMVGTLNQKETRGLHWILDEVKTGEQYERSIELIDDNLKLTETELKEIEQNIEQTRELLENTEASSVSEVQQAGLLDTLSRFLQQRDKLLEKKLQCEQKLNTIESMQVLEEPAASSSPVSPNKKLNIVVAGVLGLMVGVFGAFTVDYFRRNPLMLNN